MSVVSVVSSVVVREVLDYFCEVRGRVRIERVVWEDKIVEAWILRCALREETVLLEGSGEGGCTRLFTLRLE